MITKYASRRRALHCQASAREAAKTGQSGSAGAAGDRAFEGVGVMQCRHTQSKPSTCRFDDPAIYGSILADVK